MKNLKNQFGLFFVFLSLLSAIILVVRIIRFNPDTIVAPISETLTSVNIPFIQMKETKKDSLTQIVQSIIPRSDNDYGIVIHHLNTNETYSQNDHRMFQSGSLYKLWVMATVYDQIKNGKLRETDILKQEIPILNEKFRIATEDAELTEGTITLSIGDALYRMITVSDNYAALLLSEKVRLSTVAQFLKQHGFTESAVGTTGGFPTATASDIAQFFTLLYQGKLINKKYDDNMLDLLKQQKLNHKIPKNLPEDIVVAHKTGELNLFTHDAGIVYTPKGDYIITILSESENPDQAEETIADISEIVYRYFTE